MAFSSDDERILREMEAGLAAEDPAFVDRVRTQTVYKFAGRNCAVAGVVFVAALLVMFFTFASQLWLGFAAVLVMFGAGVTVANNLRRMGTAGRADLTRSYQAKAHGNRDVNLEQWLKDRMRGRRDE